MRPIIKSTSDTFNEQVLELTNTIYGYRHFNNDMRRCLERLGYRIVTTGNHIKVYYNNRLVTTIASTPSDTNAGHQVLRYFRSFWESYEN